jgi:hypothetical protein
MVGGDSYFYMLYFNNVSPNGMLMFSGGIENIANHICGIVTRKMFI